MIETMEQLEEMIKEMKPYVWDKPLVLSFPRTMAYPPKKVTGVKTTVNTPAPQDPPKDP